MFLCYNAIDMKKETKTKLIKLTIIIGASILIALAIYLPLELSGTIDKIDSAEELGQVIRDGGVYSYAIFILIQFLQVTFLPLPALVTTVAGTLVFENAWITFGLSLFAVMLGSIFAFFLGRKIGRKLVVWVAGEQDARKWEEKLRRGKYVYFLMMLFPIFPDDILCIVAGCIGMDWKFFLITNLITRPISIGLTCFFGSGDIIPFSGWGIPVWIVLVALAIVVMYLSIKYQPQIENFINKLAGKMSKKFSKKEDVKLLTYTPKDSENNSQEENDVKNTNTAENTPASKENQANNDTPKQADDNPLEPDNNLQQHNSKQNKK